MVPATTKTVSTTKRIIVRMVCVLLEKHKQIKKFKFSKMKQKLVYTILHMYFL